MAKFNQEVEDRITTAISSLKNQKKPNVSKTAREFKLNRRTLDARWKGRVSLIQRPPTNLKLNSEEDKALCRYLDTLEGYLVRPLPRMIVNAANAILKKSHTDPATPPPVVGEHWLKRWLGRHPNYQKQRFRAIEIDRKQAQDKANVASWFESLRKVIEVNGIVEDDIWNFDETGFRIGIGRDQWVVTRDRPGDKPYIGVSSERESITVVEAVSTGGWSAPPLIIVRGNSILQGWFDNTNIDGQYYIATSENGFMTDELGFQWIQNFWRDTKNKRKGQYTLLICDGFESHCKKEFVEFCEDHGIILFFLPPHSSHFLQPLDVGVFHAMKYWHSEAVLEATYSGCSRFTKVEFLHALSSIRAKTLKKATIRHGFRNTGISPFNPAVVLDQITEPTRPATPSTPSSHDIMSVGSTPKTAERFQNLRNRILHLHDIEPAFFHEGLDKIIRGAAQLVSYAETMQEEVRRYTEPSRQRAERAKASKRRLRSGGVVSNSNVQAMKRREVKVNISNEKKKWKRKYAKVLPELIETCKEWGIIQKRVQRVRQKAGE